MEFNAPQEQTEQHILHSPLTFLVLAVVVIVVGYVVYIQPGFFFGASQERERPTGYEELTEEEAFLLEYLVNPTERSAAENQRFADQLARVAVFTDEITITGTCRTEPLVATVLQGESFTFVNTTGDNLTLSLANGPTVTVPAGGTASTPADFGVGQGLFTYRCTGSSRPSGVISIQ